MVTAPDLLRRQHVFGPYRDHVFLEQAGPADASLIIQNVTLEDYECEINNHI